MNSHGLSRDIPEPVMREVRQRCGFGCIVCGCAIVQYHHFDPPYADAHEHKAEGITLLCGTCHDRATRGILGSDEVGQFNSNPYCKRAGFAHDFLFATRGSIHFQIGNATFRRQVVITYDNDVLVGFAPPIEVGGPLRLFAHFEDDEGTQIIDIVDNVWIAGTHHFDVQTAGSALIIRRKLGDITLRMLLSPGSELVLDRLKMGYRGFVVTIDDGKLNVRLPNGGRMNLTCPNIHSTLRLLSSGGVTV